MPCRLVAGRGVRPVRGRPLGLGGRPDPHKPVGRVHDPEELAALVRLARVYDVTIVSDEIHGPLVMPGADFTPLLNVPGAAGVGMAVVSASKAWTDGVAWLDRLLATLDDRRAALASLLHDRLPEIAWHPPAAPSWPGWTAQGSGRTMLLGT